MARNIKMINSKNLLLLVMLLLFLISCKEISKKETTKTLSELQITACNTANEAGTCDTRLSEISIVLKEDCCEVLGKCC